MREAAWLQATVSEETFHFPENDEFSDFQGEVHVHSPRRATAAPPTPSPSRPVSAALPPPSPPQRALP